MRRVKISGILNYLTISQKMVLIFFGSVILPLAIQNAFYYNDTEKNIQSGVVQRLTHSLEEKANKINGCISGVFTLSNRYNTNEDLYNFLDCIYSSDINYLTEYQSRVRDTLMSDLAFSQQVSKISLYTNNPTVLNGSLVNKIRTDDYTTLGEKPIEYKVYNFSTSENGTKLRLSLDPEESRITTDRYLSLVRPLKYFPQHSVYQKYLRVDFDMSYISSMLQESSLFDNVALVDSDNRILASANTYHEYGRYDIFSEDGLKPGIVVLKQPLKEVPLSLYGYYNSKIISDEFSKMRWKTMSIVTFSMMFALLCILFVAGNITKRTRLVVNLSKQIARGNFLQLQRDSYGNDEIEILAESMNQMSMKLKNLIEEDYNSRIMKAQLERETAQAKLLALQSQVNPHFMFNALESIRLKAVVKDETETAKMILYMSRMFRHLINWNDDVIFLREEMKFLNEFLNIQKYRFDDEFEFAVRIDEEAQDCLLPKFIIQPLVENACIHGVEAISNHRRVEIHAGIRENRLEISVCDNGNGMNEKTLGELRYMLNSGRRLTDSVGLYNVYQRLILYYDREFTFDVNSEIGHGTRIDLIIPVRHSKEEFYVFNSAGG